MSNKNKFFSWQIGTQLNWSTKKLCWGSLYSLMRELNVLSVRFLLLDFHLNLMKRPHNYSQTETPKRWTLFNWDFKLVKVKSHKSYKLQVKFYTLDSSIKSHSRFKVTLLENWGYSQQVFLLKVLLVINNDNNVRVYKLKC